jgi:3'-phosphoadenosine 5'-phosphosulfate sulfotransferase (PAPS reductase)/FAD synthetase
VTENEFILQDRLQKIRSTIEKYGEENFYLSFSGGKDSTVLSYLLDMALPWNKIPRVYANTGIEYNMIIDFVNKVKNASHCWDLIILKPSVPIKPMLEKEGYPFKSKGHSEYLERFQRAGKTTSIKQYLGEREDKEPWSSEKSCPKKLRYQFTDDFKIKISDHCCIEMKEKPLEKWKRENNKKYAIIGISRSEGGRRTSAQCTVFKKGDLKSFQPLVPVSKEWEEWLINEYNIEICDIYKEPYNFIRTGCKGCPFAIKLQDELNTLEKYFPTERKQCEIIWKPVYDEYRRIGYRLKEG